MTNERAIELLNRISDSQFDGEHGDERREALSMAVRALESNLVKGSDGLVNDLVKDCISRQQAIDALDKHIDTFDAIDKNYLSGVRTAMSILKEMPSAQPETHDKRTETHECDLISRQEAIDQLHQSYNLLDAEQRLEDLPSADPHWIPCSERLPERGTSILMTSNQGWVAEGEYKGVLDGRHLWIEYRWSASLTNGEIIAWMPLPEPYGGE